MNHITTSHLTQLGMSEATANETIAKAHSKLLRPTNSQIGIHEFITIYSAKNSKRIPKTEGLPYVGGVKTDYKTKEDEFVILSATKRKLLNYKKGQTYHVCYKIGSLVMSASLIFKSYTSPYETSAIFQLLPENQFEREIIIPIDLGTGRNEFKAVSATPNRRVATEELTKKEFMADNTIRIKAILPCKTITIPVINIIP